MRIIGYCSGVSLILLLGISQAAAAPGPGQGPPPTVKVTTVQEIQESEPKEYIGNVEAADEVDLPSRISGFITGINFKEGSLVKKGDLLFTIEDTSYRAKANAAQALLDQSSAELSYAISNFKRYNTLNEKKVVSESEFEDARRLIKLKKAVYDQRKAELLDAKNDLGYTQITAPISGRVGEVKHTLGNYVNSSSEPLATIVSVDPIQIKFSLSERDFLNLFKDVNTPNDKLRVSVKLANGEIYQETGHIIFVDNKVDADTGTISIWLSFPNPGLKLIPGGYVTVLLSERFAKKKTAVKLPAILTDVNGNYVYALDKDNAVVRRPVKLGGVARDLSIVEEGLKPGDVVIVSGTNKVRPGARVNPINENELKNDKKKTER